MILRVLILLGVIYLFAGIGLWLGSLSHEMHGKSLVQHVRWFFKAVLRWPFILRVGP